jgi:autotransporter adhesin
VATGTGAVALGENNTATGTGAVAIGNANSATGDGAVAIGNGAVASRAGQIALGNNVSTYTLAGLSSDASNAAQQGAVRLVTTDLAGNLGTMDIDMSDVAGIGGRLDALEGRVGTLENRVVALDGALSRQARRADGGIAAAMALGGTVMPPDSTFAISFNLATYRGQQGFSTAIVARVSDHVWVSGGIAGSTVRGSTGGRAGITFGW